MSLFYGLTSVHRQKVRLSTRSWLFVFVPASDHKTDPSEKKICFVDWLVGLRKDRQDVRVTKTMCSADCWTDRLVVSRLNLWIQPARRPQGKKAKKRWLSLSWNKTTRHNLLSVISRCSAIQFGWSRRELDSLSKRGTLFSCWYSMTYISQIQNLVWWMMKKSTTCWRKAPLTQGSSKMITSSVWNEAANNICKTVQRWLRDMQDSWLSRKADEIHSFADRKT